MYVYSFQINKETTLFTSIFLFSLFNKYNIETKPNYKQLEKVNIYIHKTGIDVAAFFVFCSKYNSVCII